MWNACAGFARCRHHEDAGEFQEERVKPRHHYGRRAGAGKYVNRLYVVNLLPPPRTAGRW